MTKRVKTPRSQLLMSISSCHVRITFPPADPGTTSRSLLVSVNGRASNINIDLACTEHECKVDWFSLFFIRLQDTVDGQRAGENVGTINEAALFLVPTGEIQEFSIDGLAIVLTAMS